MIIVNALQGNVHGNLNCENGAYVRLGLHLDVPSQCFRQLLTNGETQAHALGVELAMVA
jgi:hypothetical protein